MTQRLWKIGTSLLVLGVLGMLAIVISAAWLDFQGKSDSEINSAMQLASSIVLGVGFAGAIIVWLFALKFYRRRDFYFSPKQSAMYILILFCLSWLAPFIFIHLEGRERFFDFEK